MRRFLNTILLILAFLSLVALLLRFGVGPIKNLLGLGERAGVSIESTPKGSVSVNGVDLGVTPVSIDSLSPGFSLVEIKTTINGKEVGWRGNVPLNEGVITVVNRELSENTATASGEVISLEKGQGVLVISTPSEALLAVDGVERGKTPIELDLEPGSHVFTLTRASYLARSIKANVLQDRKLVISTDLSLDQADLTKIEAKPLMESRMVEILQTPTGFLRVRSGANTGSTEIGRVDTGEKLYLLEEVGSWYKVRMSDSKEGYISASYAKKL